MPIEPLMSKVDKPSFQKSRTRRRIRKGLKGAPDPEEYQQKKQALHD
jgi:hypothetical protein